MDTQDSTKHVFLFGDESSHTGECEFLVYGLVSCPEHTAVEIKDRLAFPNFEHEFKWKKCAHQIDEHKLFVETIFECIRSKEFRFECIVVNRHHMENAKYNDSDPDLALEKYIYRKLLNTALNTDPNVRFVVRLDKGREKKYDPKDMERMLNSAYWRDSGHTHSSFRSVKVVESHRSRFVQAADVLSGAVAWVWNKRYEDEDKGEEKESLATLVGKLFDTQVTYELAKVRKVKRGTYLSLGYQTQQRAERGFSIWDFDLRHDQRLARIVESKAQFSVFPPETRFSDLTRDGWRIGLECVYCGDTIKNSLSEPSLIQFNSRSVGSKSRPFCMKCGRYRVVILKPRRRDRVPQA